MHSKQQRCVIMQKLTTWAHEDGLILLEASIKKNPELSSLPNTNAF